MKKYQCIQNANVNVSPEDTIYAIKEAGFDGVFIQWYNKDLDFSQEKQLKLCRDLGLDVLFAHLGYRGINNIWLEGEEGEQLVDGYFKDLDVCKENKIDLVVMHLSSKFIAPSPSLIGIARLKKVIDYAEQLGIRIAFENNKINGYLEYLFDHINNTNIGICFDTGHCHCHFDDKFNWDKFKNKIFAVHMHDNDGTDDQHLLPFDGTIDWKVYLNILKSAGYNKPITLENCYRNEYEKMTIQEFYKQSFERAQMLEKIMEENKFNNFV